MDQRPFSSPLIRQYGSYSLLLIAAIAMIMLASWLVLSSQIFYFWDNRFYHHTTLEAWQASSEGFKTWQRFIRSTLSNDYNALFTVPLTPSMWLFGPSRLVFILSVAVLYFFPLALLCGMIGRELCTTRPTSLVLLITFIVLSLAAPWQALLLGYPDFAAALALVAALYLYLQDRTVQHLKTAFAIAALIALAILLRRHFAYAGLAFYGAAGFICLALRWRQQGFRLALFNSSWKVALAGLSTVLIMYLIAPKFTQRALLENYLTLYASYWRTLTEVYSYFVTRLGLLAPVLALSGYGYAWRRHLVDGYSLAFIMLFSGFWLLLWLTVVRQNSPQYMLHIFPLLLGIGQGLLVYSLWQGRRWHRAGALLVLGMISFACAHTFWLYDWTPSQLKAILPEPVMPLSDHALDYTQYQSVLDDLQARMQQDERLYLAASHGAMNEDVLISAEEQFYGTFSMQHQLLPISHVDSRDWLPLQELLQADLIAFTVPFISHLPTQEQDVVRVVMQAFVEGWPFSRDFRLIKSFAFQAAGGFQLQLYQRLGATDLTTALDTFWRMRSEIDSAGWLQKPWLSLSAQPVWQVTGQLGEPHQLHTTMASAEPSLLAYYLPIAGTVSLQAQVTNTTCKAGRLELISWHPRFFKTQHILSLSTDLTQHWTVTFQQPEAATLVLALIPITATCQIDLTDVSVSMQN